MCAKVCIPGLHLSLGILDRLWNLLEAECKEIDFQCAIAAGSSGNSSVEGFRKLSTLKMEVSAQQKYHEVLTQMLTFGLLNGPSVEDTVESINVEMAQTVDKIKDMVNY